MPLVCRPTIVIARPFKGSKQSRNSQTTGWLTFIPNEVKNPSPAPSVHPLPQGERGAAQGSPLPLWERSTFRAEKGRVRGFFTSFPPPGWWAARNDDSWRESS